MWKTIGILLLLIVIAVGGGVYYVATNLGAIVKSSIETYGSAATGTSLTLDSVDISVRDGSAALNGLRIANPTGYSSAPALATSKIAVTIDPQSILGDGPIIIREVLIEAPDISYEAGLAGSNLAVIEKNISEYAGAISGGSSAPKGKERKLVVEDLYVRQGSIAISHSALQGEKLATALPEIHLRNIGQGSNGATYAQVARQVLGAIIGAASKAGARALIAKVGPLGNVIGSGGAGIKSGIGGILGR